MMAPRLADGVSPRLGLRVTGGAKLSPFPASCASDPVSQTSGTLAVTRFTLPSALAGTIPGPSGCPGRAVLPPGRLHAPKVRAFVDFLAEHLHLETIATRFLCVQFTGGTAA